MPESAVSLCQTALKNAGAAYVVAQPPKGASEECTVANPVRLQSVSIPRKSGAESVKLSGEPLLSCDMALAVTAWVQHSIAPLARGHFDEPLLEIGVGGGFECRQRNHQSSAPRSEHSYGRALDLLTFRLVTRMIKVEKAPPPEVKPFLDAVWSSGCGQFSTALGPEADSFHETHIHVDQQPRRSSASKFCE